MAVSLSEAQPDVLSPAAKYQVFVYHADACYHSRQYKAAEVRGVGRKYETYVYSRARKKLIVSAC